MTEINLQPSWPSYQSHKQMYCCHSSARSIHNFRKNTYLAVLDATFIGPELCKQFKEKPSLMEPDSHM